MFYVWPNGKFLIFLFLFGLLAIKAMAFWKISLLALCCALNCVLCMAKHKISNISPFVWCIGCQSHGILENFTVFPLKYAISQTCQNKFINLIPPSYCIHFGKYNYRCKIHHFYAKCHVNKIYKYGYCPGYMYIRYGMLVQYQIVFFMSLH